MKYRDRRPLRPMAIELLENRILLAVDHVVHISVDGLASRWLEPLLRAEERNSSGDYSTFLELQNEGAWTLNARTDANYTLTLPNHSSMLTGRPVLEHNSLPLQIGHAWTDNNDPPVGQTLHANHPDLDYVSSVFDVVHDQGGSQRCMRPRANSRFSTDLTIPPMELQIRIPKVATTVETKLTAILYLLTFLRSSINLQLRSAGKSSPTVFCT